MDFHEVLPERHDHPLALAWLSRGDFARARLRAPGFSNCDQYADFVAERDALLLTLGTAGVAALVQAVPFAAFEVWTRLTGAALDLDRLDEFAAHWRWRTDRPSAVARGWLGDPNASGRDPVAVSGLQWIIFRPDPFLNWREEVTGLRSFDAASLDVYATHVVDCCLPSTRGVARSTAHSA